MGLKNSIFHDNFIYLIYLLSVFSLTIFHFNGFDEFYKRFPYIGDNNAYLFIIEKLESLNKNENYDLSHSIAIPGLGYILFLIKKILGIPNIYAYLFTGFLFYFLTLNIIRSLFSSLISFVFLITGWEFVMTSTTGGTEPVLCFLVLLSISLYLKDKLKLSLICVAIASVVKPFAISLFAAYGFVFLFKKEYKKIFEIIIFFFLTVFLFFYLNNILYDGEYLLVFNSYREIAWLNIDNDFNYPLITFLNTLIENPHNHKLDFIVKIITYLTIFVLSLVICFIKLNKNIKIKSNEIFFYTLLCYFLIVIFYPSKWSVYEFVRFITPVMPFALYFIIGEFKSIERFYLNNKIYFYILIFLSSIFYSFVNLGIKPSLLKYFNFSY